ncbi:hypothetical protein E2542_SST01143 [Spatholobus suberectus]|nr:hypothetical protein E2542_SST01143 [Spatholobus suberectus]
MPFPWKKNRVPRISQIVADLQSPKRGGSLVVETGFPTSLIDLFVKNRSRFRKHRSKKPPPPDIPDPPPPPPSPATPPPPHPELRVPSPQTEQNDDAVLVPDRAPECSHGSGRERCCRLCEDFDGVGFNCERAEAHGGDHRVGVCASASRIRRETRRFVFCCGIVVPEGSEEGACAGLSIELRGGDVASELLLESCISEVSECKIRGSRSGRFRSKMVKKLVPKKFRGSKKEKKSKHNEGESGSEVSNAVEEDKLPILEIQEEEEEEEDNGDKSSNTKLDEVDCGITCSYDEKRVDRVGNSGSSMVLVMIALLGLLLGRVPALVLSMTWCCSMKIVRTLWRSHNVPLIKCSVSNS